MVVKHRDARCHVGHLLEQAAELLPTQGPLTSFVHHNTLHAFEELPFAEAVEKAAGVYGCQPYLFEDRYRDELARGRILPEDLTAVLLDDLGERADDLVGLLGTRFHLRMTMLRHAMRSAPSAELRWVVAETDALRTFRDDMPPSHRQRLIQMTRRWITREFGSGEPAGPAGHLPTGVRATVAEVLSGFGRRSFDDWSDADWESCCLQLLWKACVAGVRSAPQKPVAATAPPRHRDLLWLSTGVDTDELVHDVLIRYCAAFLDQGLAHWPLPGREDGFFRSFLELYGERGGLLTPWRRALPLEAQQLLHRGASAEESIVQSLDKLGIEEHDRERFLTATVLALPGWAGMLSQMETQAEWSARPAPPGTLVEFVAVRLLLDLLAATHVAGEHLGVSARWQELLPAALARMTPAPTGNTQRAFVFFQLTQVLGIAPEELLQLPPKTWGRLADEIDAFSEIPRRRTFHQAYERRRRNQTLDALVLHSGRIAADRKPAAPSFQIVCCIDDREESFRRHLEEVDPRCETLASAGFFGVAMYYRGAADAHPRPLCPVVIKPTHYVEEHPVFTSEELHQRRARARRWLGSASHQVHHGSRSLLGGALTALAGSLASAPLVARILFPRVAAKIRHMFGRITRPPSATRLLMERSQPTPGPEPGHVGYSVEEMADVVQRCLGDVGLTSRYAPLVLICGHGSSSLNNPHESAYNCGACSGGRGGPNARTFAQMANDPRVRAILADRGLTVPPSTYFLGAYHNTCNDRLEYFDLDRLPTTHSEAFKEVARTLDEARRRNAHERCRRFESLDLSISPAAALAHVEERAEDLSQARPEFNHATNAACLVGRRRRTRGMFMDRRVFLASYDPTQDDERRQTLERILAAVVPVCAGISLEYFFSCVDVQGYGCGSKLPHNITSLLGVMEGAASDLRAGLSAQMTEIHEPLRLLFVVETTPAAMLHIISGNPTVRRLCDNEWVQLATLDPESPEVHIYRCGRFEPYVAGEDELPWADSSLDWYRGWRDHLGFASIANADSTPASKPRAASGAAAMKEAS